MQDQQYGASASESSPAQGNTVTLSDDERDALRQHVTVRSDLVCELLGHAKTSADFEQMLGRAHLYARVWRAVDEGALVIDSPMFELLRDAFVELEATVEDEEDVLRRLRAGDMACLVAPTVRESERDTTAAITRYRGAVAALDGLLARAGVDQIEATR